jgi:hypothetical protein
VLLLDERESGAEADRASADTCSSSWLLHKAVSKKSLPANGDGR